MDNDFFKGLPQPCRGEPTLVDYKPAGQGSIGPTTLHLTIAMKRSETASDALPPSDYRPLPAHGPGSHQRLNLTDKGDLSRNLECFDAKRPWIRSPTHAGVEK